MSKSPSIPKSGLSPQPVSHEEEEEEAEDVAMSDLELGRLCTDMARVYFALNQYKETVEILYRAFGYLGQPIVTYPAPLLSSNTALMFRSHKDVAPEIVDEVVKYLFALPEEFPMPASI